MQVKLTSAGAVAPGVPEACTSLTLSDLENMALVNNPTLVHKHLKTLRYAELKARDWLDRGKPAQMWLTPFVHVSAFLKDYVLRLAFLDGWRGYIVSQVAASYAVYKRMRYYEMKRNPESRKAAADLLHSYGLDP